MDTSDIFTKGLNVNDALDLLWTASVYTLFMAAYAVFVFKFYRFVASRDMFAVDLSRYEDAGLRWLKSSFHVVIYILKYLILFPVFAFFWFAVLTLILAFLSKGQAFSDSLLIAIATVGAIRVTAYYRESLSRDLAKILPFTVLAVFLVDVSFFSVDESIESLKEARDYTEDILYYLLLLIVLEFVLRLLKGIFGLIAGPDRGQTQTAAGQGWDDPADRSDPDAWDRPTDPPASGGVGSSGADWSSDDWASDRG